MTTLEREWRAKLAASGFQDLEGVDRDAPLSVRGNLHAVNDTEEDAKALASRIEVGQQVTERRQAILHSARFRSPEQRRCWELLTDGASEREIAAAVGVTRDRVRKHLAAVEKMTQVREGLWRNQSRQRNYERRRLIRRCDPRMLVQIAALLLSGLTPTELPTKP